MVTKRKILNFYLQPLIMFCLLSSMDEIYAQDEGLIGWWGFDEGQGSVVRDASDKGHHGTVKDAKWAPGKVNKALNFDNGGFVQIPDHPDLRLQKDFTIAAWIK